MVTRVVTSLTGHAAAHSGTTSTGMALSLMTLDNQTIEFQQRKVVTEILTKLSAKKLGTNFLLIVSVNYVNALMEVSKNLGLVNPYSQWLYVISDTANSTNDLRSFTNLITEGDNIAFVYNKTTDTPDCKVGLSK